MRKTACLGAVLLNAVPRNSWKCVDEFEQAALR